MSTDIHADSDNAPIRDTPVENKNNADEQKEEEITLKPDSGFFSFNECQSQDADNPDIVKVIVVDTEPIETKHSTCLRVKDLEGKEMLLPLQSKNSPNTLLYDLVMEGIKRGKIKPGKKLTIKTWLAVSKFGRKIRRYKLLVV